MMTVRGFMLGAALAGLAVGGHAAAQTRLAATQTNLDTNALQTTVTPQANEAAPSALTPGVVVPMPGDPRLAVPPRERDQRGNPLWGIPMKLLNATRERPIFLPSRRAPPPAVAGPPVVVVVPPPPPPAAPERPRLSLVGAIAGGNDGFAFFLDEATRNVVKLRTGENHMGWILRSVRGREAVLQKDRESIVLSLPSPDERKQMPPPAADQL